MTDSELLDFDIIDDSFIVKSGDLNIANDPYNGDDNDKDKDKKKKSVSLKQKRKYNKNQFLHYQNALFPEKSSLSREEKKNIMAMRLFAKMDQVLFI